MALTKGSDFNCSGTICYGIGSQDQQFRQLQTLINAAQARLGVGSPIAVDGKIGPATVQAVLLLGRSPAFSNSVTIAKVKASPRPETVASVVPELSTVFADPSSAFDASTPNQETSDVGPLDSILNKVKSLFPSPDPVPIDPYSGTNVPTGGGQQVSPYPTTTSSGNTGIMPPGLPQAPKSHLWWWIGGLAGLGLLGFAIVKISHRHHDEPAEPPP